MIARTLLVALGLLVTAESLAGQNIVVVLDDSGSMSDALQSDRRTLKIDAAKQALLTVLEKLPADAQIGVVALNGGGADHWIIRLGKLDPARLNAAVQQIYASGGTPLGEFMKIGADALLTLREKERYGTYKLLIVTDGEANDQELVESYLPDILSRGLVVDVIGVDMRQDHSLATQVHTYRRADDARSLQQAIAEVVLGESTLDAGDAGESDFELLGGLPNDVATSALEALTRSSNQPVAGKVAMGGPAGPGAASALRPQPQ